ncbi:hypothetical protein [Bradyrhizobium sp. BR 10261]|uniref:hypothetical protein n=1 Tax=Bradyrhizobium sp. BR 10261 TaxID=2749992 RepID=UPI001C653474|nr:hypothetical protein [Bradyrhizobium sp. BR 10261]MBW7967054.1 hypothetical protein [Bradyrhizobium sp. BR 10261]
MAEATTPTGKQQAWALAMVRMSEPAEEGGMNPQRLEEWSIDELWTLHVEVDAALAASLILEMNELERAKLGPLVSR